MEPADDTALLDGFAAGGRRLRERSVSVEDVLARARRAWLDGDDAEAERILADERRRARHVDDRTALLAVEAELAAFSSYIDEDERAEGHLAMLLGQSMPAALRVRAWTARAQLDRKRGASVALSSVDSAVEAEVRASDDPEALISLAALVRVRGRAADAAEIVEKARTLAQPGSYASALALEELAEQRLAANDVLRARDAQRQAIAALSALSLQRAEGRAMLWFADSIAPAAPGEEFAAVWLGRARARLGTSATWRDRAAVRTGLRIHGRRLPDAAVAESILDRVETLDRACSSLRSRLSLGAAKSGRAFDDAEAASALLETTLDAARESLDALPRRVTPLLREIEGVGGELLELTGATLVDRDRMRVLVRALAELDGETETIVFAKRAAGVIASVLEADRLLVIDATDERALVVIGEAGDPADESYSSLVLAALRLPSRPPGSQPPSLRDEAKPTGPVLVSAIRSNAFAGAIYADKKRRSGQFRESDHHLASLAAEYLAQSLARLHAHEAGRRALSQLETTLDAIRDGVVALDRVGTVTSFNAAAARLLRVSVAEATGKKLASLPQLAPLAEALSASQRPDGLVVRLAHGAFVVTARPIAGSAAGEAPGTVATLVELDRAERLAARITHARPRYGFHDVIGSSQPMADALRLARQASQVDASVLITGESGTGKEVIAQALHTGGPRASEPFVGINCAALPRELLEAELFGYERGAFTGARNDGSLGKLELAGEGTLLLDEIGDMPLDMQVKLLRVLQERVVVRLGGAEERPMLARVLATTHKNLEEGVERGTFRLDLLYRLRVLTIHLPPLRARRDDIRPLALHFLRRLADAQKKRLTDLSPELHAELAAYDWPGNVRELANVMEREVSLSPPDIPMLQRFQVPLDTRPKPFRDTPSSVKMRTIGEIGSSVATIVPLAEVERRAYLDALDACGGNVTRAAKALGVSRANFYAKLRVWNVDAGDDPGPETMRRIRTIEADAVRPPPREDDE